MKTWAIFLLLASHIALAGDVYETSCHRSDCFKSGWTTVSVDRSYSLETSCKKHDCARFGWFSVANDGSTYDVTCLADGCFTAGWQSEQKTDGSTLLDAVTCKGSGCLIEGWTVTTGYDLMGGSVTCHSSDCARFGGTSFWRGRPSHTVCYDQDCYHEGWTLFIE